MTPLLLSTIALAAPVDLDEPLRTGARADADAAVVIGIEDYAFIPDVPYARRDAALFHDWLVYSRGVPAERVSLLQDASREQIERALSAATEAVGPSGTLWVYFAGHGAASAIDASRMVLGVDVMADPAVFHERALGVEALSAAASTVPTLVVMDTCYAGVGRAGAELVPGTRFAVPGWAATPGPQTVLWGAAGANELAGPLEAVRHGAFTWLVVGALRGWADGEVDGHKDGQVTLAEAHAWVGRTLRASPLRQQPELLAEAELEDWVVAAAASEAAPSLADVWVTPASPAVPALASAGPCPWDEVDDVQIKMTTVVVNDTSHLVTGKANRTAFHDTLTACGEVEAAEYFRQWRAHRRTANSLWYPLVLPSLIPAVRAGGRSDALELALEAP